ncbi:MAG: metallopeptidase [Patescibacteria group bacterium]|nr:MAG: metallopeptidase [Patescibacteria group bacterium]
MIKKRTSGIFWEDATDVKRKIEMIKEGGEFSWLDLEAITCLRSYGSKSRAIARIWGLPKLWQKVLKLKPHYVIEVVSEKYDKLNNQQKEDVLLHEIAHIPKNFSGSLVPHYRKGRRKFKDLVKNLKLRYHLDYGNNSSSRRR